MRLISHRGNLYKRQKAYENNPEYIMEAITNGYEVEIDLWYEKGEFYLGHDKPEHKINNEFIEHPKFWCHAKNLAALNIMLQKPRINCFYHDKDIATLTTHNYIWTYPGNELYEQSICVMPEEYTLEFAEIKCAGICSDMIGIIEGIQNGRL